MIAFLRKYTPKPVLSAYHFLFQNSAALIYGFPSNKNVCYWSNRNLWKIYYRGHDQQDMRNNPSQGRFGLNNPVSGW